MARFIEIDHVLDRPLRLPCRGKVYEVHPVDGRTEIYLAVLAEHERRRTAGEEISDADLADVEALHDANRSWNERMLGETLEVLHADGVPGAFIRHMARTVAHWTLSDCNDDVAAATWANPPGAETDAEDEAAGPKA